MKLLELPDDNKLLEIERARAEVKSFDERLEFTIEECHKRHLIWIEIDEKMRAQLDCKDFNMVHLGRIPYAGEEVLKFREIQLSKPFDSQPEPEPFVKAHMMAIENREYYKHYLSELMRIVETKKTVALERKHQDH